MSKTLVVVESPSKVKKIQSYLGDNYIVTSSMGHFRGLDHKKMSIDIQNNYTPEFIDISGKKDVISNLKKLYKTCNGVLLASDGDNEGAAIAHHVFELLKVKPEHRKRIIFNEITQIKGIQKIRGDESRVYGCLFHSNSSNAAGLYRLHICKNWLLIVML